METWSRGLDLRELARVYGTPLYVVHPPTLRSNFARWVRLVGRPERVRYPVKANPSPEVLEEIAALGGGADCASRLEVWAALEAGIALDRVTYNSPALDLDLAAWLLRSGASVVADSAEHLAALAERVAPHDLAGRLLVRVNPGGLPGYRRAAEIHRYTAHGADNSQFGIPSEVLPKLLARYPLPVTGVHMHVGTQMDNVDTFVAGLGFLHGLVDVLGRRTGRPPAVVDLGGGLGIPFQDDQRFPSIDALVDALLPLCRQELEYQVEPGNSLVGDAAALLARVVAVKTMRGRRWGILDVGTDQLVKFTVARWEHQIVDAEHRPLEREGPDALAGPLCFAGDVFLPATRLDHVRPGDPVLIRHAGAYCEAVASRFNGRVGPAHVVVDDDGAIRVVRGIEDPFFAPAVQTYRPPALTAEGNGAAGGGRGSGAGRPGVEVLDAATVAALQSRYMHRDAEADGYTIVRAERVGERAYRFEVEPRAAVDFVAMPLALRIAGDASIIAVGHALGWREKARPVWATRLTLKCGRTLGIGGPFPCRVAVGALRPAPTPGVAWVGTVRFRLGAGEIEGAARVVVPEA
ncbi:MAG TPA: hypothetical protein VF158_14155 [Longimicrobiales bacterium]